jgi:protein-L-isoaspartate(D-aspartate) O-methyltransferase
LSADDFEIRRRQMIERQLVPRGITDELVLAVVARLPRHLFVEEALQGKAYSDNALPIGAKQTISQPYIVALMTQLLRVSPEDRVLEIGTGSGYQTALLASLADNVYTVERLRILSTKAKATLRQIGLENVHFRVGDGTAGWPEEAPFSRILVTAGAPAVPAPLLAQLDTGGRLVIPVGEEKQQAINVVIRGRSGFRTEQYDACVFVKLIGQEGWAEVEDS